MKIKYLSGPNEGKIEHVSNEVGRVVISAGLAEETSLPVTPTPPNPKSSIEQLREHQRFTNPAMPPDQPRWSVEYLGLIQKSWFIVLRIGGYEVKFGGDPKIVNARRTWEGGGYWLSGFGRECPAHIVKEYAARYGSARQSERWYPPVPVAPGKSNDQMAQEKKVKEQTIQETNEALANFDVRKDLAVSNVIGGPDASEVIYEQSDPAKGA